MRALRGAAGSKVSLTIIRGNPNDPHVVELTREAVPATDVTSRMAAPGRRVPARSPAVATKTADQAARPDRGAHQGRRHVAHRRRPPHLRRVARRRHGAGAAVRRQRHARACARRKGRATRDDCRRPATARITLPTTRARRHRHVGRRRVFAAALAGNKRADSIGEHTIGRAAQQKLVKLPDGSGLWLTRHPLSHARRHTASREGPRADRRRRRSRKSKFGEVPPTERSRPRQGARAASPRRRRPPEHRPHEPPRSSLICYTGRSSNACIFKM